MHALSVWPVLGKAPAGMTPWEAQKAPQLNSDRGPLGGGPSGTGLSLAYLEPQQRTEKLRRNQVWHFENT